MISAWIVVPLALTRFAVPQIDGGKAVGDKLTGEHPHGRHSIGEQLVGDRLLGEHAASGHSINEHQSGGVRSEEDLVLFGSPADDELDESPPAEETEAVEPLRHAKWAALIDGGWSVVMTAAWVLSARTWDAPYGQGIVGLITARVLYGTTWSLLLTSEIALLRLIVGERWVGLSRARIKNTWLFGRTIPGDCSEIRSATCGLGLGGYSELSVRVHEGRVPIELVLAGGWIQGHHSTNERRTLMESTWVQSPIVVRGHFPARLGPLALELALGGGFAYGMHNAHLHPRAGDADELGLGFHELRPLHYGLGPLFHARGSISILDTVSLEAGLDLAPFLWSHQTDGAGSDFGPLTRPEASKFVLWRRATVGLGLDRRFLHPVRLGARWFGLELSPRPFSRFGHSGVVLEFEVPFELSRGEDGTTARP